MMSTHALELVLWEITHYGDVAKAFREDSKRLLKSYQITQDECAALETLDVKSLAARGVSPLLIMQAWNTIQGPDKIGDYLARMNRQ
jgi:hypothetical protein